jgi:hypothetical protein
MNSQLWAVTRIVTRSCALHAALLALAVLWAWPTNASACQGSREVRVWPPAAAVPATPEQVARAFTIPSDPDAGPNTAESKTLCVLDIPEKPEPGRTEFELSGAKAWVMLSLPGVNCDTSSPACADAVGNALRRERDVLLAGESPGADTTGLTEAVLSWVRDSPPSDEVRRTAPLLGSTAPENQTPSGSDARRRLARQLWSVARPVSVDTAKPITWRTKASEGVARRFLVAEPTTDSCMLELVQKRREAFQVHRHSDVVAHWVAHYVDNVAARTVRITIAQRDGCATYCTGYLLNDKTVLTARHCIGPVDFVDGPEPAPRPSPREVSPIPNCAEKTADCSSFSVEVDYRKGSAAPAILAVHHAIPSPRFDFGLLYLGPAKTVAERAAVEEAAVQQAFAADMEIPLRLLSHPDGAPLRQSDCVVLDDNRDHWFIVHRCGTSGGSSGALLWTRNDHRPIGIHTNGFNHCWSRAKGDPGLPQRVAQRVRDLYLARRPCVGVAVKTASVLVDTCLGDTKMTEVCALLTKGLLDRVGTAAQ